MIKQDIDKAFSNKITLFSLAFSIIIVCYHLNPTFDFQTITNDGSFFDVVFNFLNSLMDSLGSLAVSFFFLSSAFLLYRNLTWRNFPEKLKRRFFTLFIPLLLWNVIGLIYKVRFSDGFLEILKNILLSNYDGPLWFVVQILVLFLLSPLFLKVFSDKKLGLLLLCVLYFLPMLFEPLIVGHITENTNLITVFVRGFHYLPLYFTGVYLGLHYDSAIRQERYQSQRLNVISIVMLLISLIPSDKPFFAFIGQFQILFLWALIPKKPTNLNWYHQISYFIYASHVIAIGILMRLFHRFLIDEALEVSITAAFFYRMLFTVLSMLCIYLVAWILIRRLPKLFGLLTGDRLP